MKKYRIIEEKNIHTNKSIFYIQVKKRFLFYTWWERLTYPVYLSSSCIAYNKKSQEHSTLDSAKKELYQLTNEVEYYIHE